MKRICIYPKDIARITGKSYRQSLRIYNELKSIHAKQPHQLISVDELGNYLGLKVDAISERL